MAYDIAKSMDWYISIKNRGPEESLKKFNEACAYAKIMYDKMTINEPGMIDLGVKNKLTIPCIECRGTGKYTGLNLVENCITCNGKGNI